MALFIIKFSKKQKREIAEYYVNNNSTVRKTAEHFGISKTNIHRALKEFQEDKSTAGTPLALSVAELSRQNIKARSERGGQTTKQKYSKKK